MASTLARHELDNGSSISGRARTFSILRRVQLRFEVYRVSFPTDNGGTLRGLKRLER
jgi:hypothetical protein